MSQTQATLVKHVLQDLGALAAGATVDTDDSALVVDRLAGIYADLSSRRIYVVADPANLADDAYPSLLRIVAELCAPAFGRPTNKAAIDAAETALRELQRYAAADRTTLRLSVLERMGALSKGQTADSADLLRLDNLIVPALADLAQRRITPTLTPTAVPDALFGPLVTYLAELARAAFSPPGVEIDLKASLELRQGAERELAELTRRDRTANTGLTRQVLELLELWGAGTATIDGTAISDRTQGILDDLSKRRIITIASVGALTPEATPHVARIVAASLTPKPALDIITEAEKALVDLTRLSRSSSYTALTSEVFDRLSAIGKLPPALDSTVVVAQAQQVLDDLAKRRIVTFANEAAITSQARRHIALIVASVCVAGAFAPESVAAAEAALAAIARRDRTANTGLYRQVLELLEVWGAATQTIDNTAIADRTQGILDDLSARRIIVFANVAAISTAAMPHIARLVAAQLTPKPLFDVIATAEAALMTIGRLSRTSTGIVRRVLEKLQFWGVAAAVDETHVSERVQETLDDLAMRDVIFIADVDSIASETMPHLATILATCFLPPSPANERAVKNAEIALSRIDRNGSTTPPTVFEYASQFQRARRGSYVGS